MGQVSQEAVSRVMYCFVITPPLDIAPCGRFFLMFRTLSLRYHTRCDNQAGCG